MSIFKEITREDVKRTLDIMMRDSKEYLPDESIEPYGTKRCRIICSKDGDEFSYPALYDTEKREIITKLERPWELNGIFLGIGKEKAIVKFESGNETYLCPICQKRILFREKISKFFVCHGMCLGVD